MANFMFYFPPSQFADFFAGATAAALAKSHQAIFKRWLKPSVQPSAGLCTAFCSFLPRLILSCLVDACFLMIALIVLQPVNVDPVALTNTTDSSASFLLVASLDSAAKKEAALYHTGTLPMCLFLYLSVPPPPNIGRAPA